MQPIAIDLDAPLTCDRTGLLSIRQHPNYGDLRERDEFVVASVLIDPEATRPSYANDVTIAQVKPE
jgi:hypothetical protein